MATGKHIGKVLLKIRDEEPDKKSSSQPSPKTVASIPRTYMNPDKSYVLVGGLGGFGLELANWLVTRGAKHVVLTSRSGVRTGYQALCVRRWREIGINVAISTDDVTTPAGAEKLIKAANKLGKTDALPFYLCPRRNQQVQCGRCTIITSLIKTQKLRNIFFFLFHSVYGIKNCVRIAGKFVFTFSLSHKNNKFSLIHTPCLGRVALNLTKDGSTK